MSQPLCGNCGHPLPNDTGTYCPHCGEPRPDPEDGLDYDDRDYCDRARGT